VAADSLKPPLSRAGERDRVLVPLPDGRWLAMDRDVFEAALIAGAEATIGVPGGPPSSAGSPVEPLLDARQAAEKLSVTARILDDYARAGIAPHYKLGRYLRFRVSEVAAHFRVAGAAPPTDSRSVTSIRRLARQ
jgi:hypothetical protein